MIVLECQDHRYRHDATQTMTDEDDGPRSVSPALAIGFQLLEEGPGVVSRAGNAGGAPDRAIVLITQHPSFGHASGEQVARPDDAVCGRPRFDAASLTVVNGIEAVYQNHAARRERWNTALAPTAAELVTET